MKRLRVGVVGVGHLGQHHARLLAKIPEVELVGVADASGERARVIAERHQTAAFSDYRDLLDRVDAVTVAVPTVLHRDVAGAFLDRGIATLVEKPLASSLAEAEELVRLADNRQSALLQVGHIERFNPALKVLDSLRLRPQYVTAERLSTYTFRSTDIGAVLDLMIHDIDLVLALIAAPVRAVSAVGFGLFGRHEDVAEARIEFANGGVARLTASRVSYQKVRKMGLWSAEAHVALDFATGSATIVRPNEGFRRGEVEPNGLDLTNADAIRDHIFGKVFRVEQEQGEKHDALTVELEEFVQAVMQGTQPQVDGEDALQSLQVAERILECIRSHRWEDAPVDLPLVGGPMVATEPSPALHGPFFWRARKARSGSSKPSR